MYLARLAGGSDNEAEELRAGLLASAAKATLTARLPTSAGPGLATSADSRLATETNALMAPVTGDPMAPADPMGAARAMRPKNTACERKRADVLLLLLMQFATCNLMYFCVIQCNFSAI